MDSQNLRFKEILVSKFWLVPSVIAIILIGLSLLLQGFELPAGSYLGELLKKRPVSVQGAQHILSSTATALMTVISVLFSITVVVLQQVSTQYSPRVIENFIRSKISQTVLGVYIGTFGYCLILLRGIRKSDTQGEIAQDQLAVIVAVALALLCLALLIFYIHHIVKAIKSNHILYSLRCDTLGAISSLDRDLKQLGAASLEGSFRDWTDPGHNSALCQRSGYLQEIRWSQFPRILGEETWRLEVTSMAGDFIHEGMPLAQLQTEKPLTDKQHRKILNAFPIHLERTHSQDPRFGVKQMVDIALRALSPGINDPSTAMEAINEIGVVLIAYTKADIRSSKITYSSGSLLELKFPTYEQFLGLCFHQILVAGQTFYAILLRVRSTLAHCQSLTEDPERLRVLKLHERQVLVMIEELDSKTPLHLLGTSRAQLDQ